MAKTLKNQRKRRKPWRICGHEGACPNFFTASECAYYFGIEQLIPARSLTTLLPSTGPVCLQVLVLLF